MSILTWGEKLEKNWKKDEKRVAKKKKVILTLNFDCPSCLCIYSFVNLTTWMWEVKRLKVCVLINKSQGQWQRQPEHLFLLKTVLDCKSPLGTGSRIFLIIIEHLFCILWDCAVHIDPALKSTIFMTSYFRLTSKLVWSVWFLGRSLLKLTSTA